ncbi:Hypothetical_protein [Hexamita inflata]|uniref:Hypothetical_protein n=1 Tax=Hexamita inflata TaxID=28002 RepID=A0ABP1KTL9_9EUKA
MLFAPQSVTAPITSANLNYLVKYATHMSLSAPFNNQIESGFRTFTVEAINTREDKQQVMQERRVNVLINFVSAVNASTVIALMQVNCQNETMKRTQNLYLCYQMFKDNIVTVEQMHKRIARRIKITIQSGVRGIWSGNSCILSQI